MRDRLNTRSALAVRTDDRMLRLLHALLGLMAPLLALMLLAGCAMKEAEPIDYGPEVPEAQVMEAISKPLASSDPSKIKVGEFVHLAETQEIAGNKNAQVLSDTGQTVIDREEDATQILFTVVETKIVYTDSESRKTSTEFPVLVQKAAATPAMVLTSASADARVTFHNLKTSVAKEPPPEAVRAQPNCVGLPDCQLTVHRVTFDQVLWENGTPNRMNYEFVMSPDAPFLAQVLVKCITLMVPVGTSGAKTLLRQCTPVVNFRFESPTP